MVPGDFLLKYMTEFEIITLLLFYMLIGLKTVDLSTSWSFRNKHPTSIPVMAILWPVVMVAEIILSISNMSLESDEHAN